MTKIRSRFAPSPTGYLHIGNLRTALYAYLFAKKNNGTFIIRIEDTDQARYIEGAKDNLLKILDYFGIKNDEGVLLNGEEKGDKGPYTQSLRKELHLKHALDLIEKGHAYYCFCSVERLSELREKQKKANLPPMYDKFCTKLSKEEIQKRLDSGEKYVIRQNIPYEEIKYKDLIRGSISFHGKTIDDQVLIKSDGLPTYHLANVVDDHLMEVSHVIRGEEWIPSVPKHLFLYKSFAWEAPNFAHLTLIVNKDRSKLSKRQGDVAVEDFLKKGYLKEAIINFVALLGWNPGEGSMKEIFSLEELEEAFSIEKINKSSAYFDLEKLNWFNYNWEKINSSKELIKIAKEIDKNCEINTDKKNNTKIFFSDTKDEELFKIKKGEYLFNKVEEYIEEDLKEKNKDLIIKALSVNEDKIYKDKKNIQKEIEFFIKQPDYETSLFDNEKMKSNKELSKKVLKRTIEILSEEDDWTEKHLYTIIKTAIEEMGTSNGQFLWPIRVALSGLESSPGVFECLWVLGKEESIKRIKKAEEKF